MNEKEEKILEELKKDSRKPIKSISKVTRIKPSTVYNIINRLKERGIIERFSVKVKDQRNFIVFILVNTAQDISLEDPCIEEAFGITGEYDLLMKLRFRNVEEFNRFIIRFRKNKNILKTHTFVATATIKAG